MTIVVRPEDVRLAAARPAAETAFEGVLEDMIYLGANVKYRIALPSGQRITAISPDRATRRSLTVGSPAWAGWALDDQRVIDE